MTLGLQEEQGDVPMTLAIQSRQRNAWHWLEPLSSCCGVTLPAQTEKLSLTLMKAAENNTTTQL